MAGADAHAASGVIRGRAATSQGSVAVVSANINHVALSADGTPVTLSLPLNVGAEANLGVAGNLTLGVSADSVVSHCEGVPSGSTVRAECWSRVEGLNLGLTLETLLTTSNATVVSASVLEAHSESSSSGGAPSSSSAGTTILGLCVYGNGSVCTAVNGTATVNVSLLGGVVTGSVQVLSVQPRSSDAGTDGSGLTVTMLRISLSTALGQLVQLDIAVADSFVGDVVADPTPTATPTEPPASTPSATPTPQPSTPAPPTATPSPTATPPAAGTPGPTATPPPSVPIVPAGPIDVPGVPPPSQSSPTPPSASPGATQTQPPSVNPPAGSSTQAPPAPTGKSPTPRPPATGQGAVTGGGDGPYAWLPIGVAVAVASAGTAWAVTRRPVRR